MGCCFSHSQPWSPDFINACRKVQAVPRWTFVEVKSLETGGNVRLFVKAQPKIVSFDEFVEAQKTIAHRKMTSAEEREFRSADDWMKTQQRLTGEEKSGDSMV